MENCVIGTILDDFQNLNENDDPSNESENTNKDSLEFQRSDKLFHEPQNLPDLLANVSAEKNNLLPELYSKKNHDLIKLPMPVSTSPNIANLCTLPVTSTEDSVPYPYATGTQFGHTSNFEIGMAQPNELSQPNHFEIPGGTYNPFLTADTQSDSKPSLIHYPNNNTSLNSNTHNALTNSSLNDVSNSNTQHSNIQYPMPPSESTMPHRINSMLGYEKPFWIPDDQADACMYCDQKFTIVRRRHHCRACGKILCSACCNKRLTLPSMDFKLSRVCTACFQLLNNDLPTSSGMNSSITDEDHEDINPTDNTLPKIASKIVIASSSEELPPLQKAPKLPNTSPNPMKPEEYCSTIPPLIQAQTSCPQKPPVVYVPIAGVLKNANTPGGPAGCLDGRLSSSKQQQPSSSSCSGKKKRVMFSDGIRPGGDLSLLDDLMASTCTLSNPTTPSSSKHPAYGCRKMRSTCHGRIRSKRINSLNKNGGTTYEDGGGNTEIDDSSSNKAYFIVSALNYPPPLRLEFKRTSSQPLAHDDPRVPMLIVSEHLKIKATLLSLDCCSPQNEDKRYLCLTTVGMRNVGQREIVSVFLLPEQLRESAQNMDAAIGENCQPSSNTIARLILEFGYQMHQLYTEILKGNQYLAQAFLPINFMSNKDYAIIIDKRHQSPFSPNGNSCKSDSLEKEDPEGGNEFRLFNNKLHGGFLLFPPRQPFHCLQNLSLPPGDEPFLFALLVHRWETPWAKMLPLRLLLRLGLEYKTYPYPFISILDRKSTFYELNHTIINLLADSRNFTYTLPRISGFYLSIRGKTVTLNVCRENLKEVLNIISQSTISDHVLAFAGNLHGALDAHMVCVQDESSGQYNSENFLYQVSPNDKSIGATFVVFNGSLKDNGIQTSKSSSHYQGNGDSVNCGQPSNIRISIVEDGIIVHVTPHDLTKITGALKGMADLELGGTCSTGNDLTTMQRADNSRFSDMSGRDHEKTLFQEMQADGSEYFQDDEWAFNDMPSTHESNQSLQFENGKSGAIKHTVKDEILLDFSEQKLDAEKGEMKDRLLIKWIDGEKMERKQCQKAQNSLSHRSVRSLIDGANLEKVSSIRPFNFVDYVKGNYMIRLVEIFYIKTDAIFMAKNDSLDIDKLAESLSKAFCSCIVQRLNLLASLAVFRINLKISVDSNQVGYELSHLGKEYQPYLAEIDDYLIPIIHSALNYTAESGGSLVIELLFNILPALTPSDSN